MLTGSGVFDFLKTSELRIQVSVDESGTVVEWYSAHPELFDESVVEGMRTRLLAWNMSKRALRLLP
jgi:hypothetical protein